MATARTQVRDRAPSPEPVPMAPVPELLAPTPQSPLSAIMQRAAADPRSLTRADAMQLQRTIGNAAVAQLLTKAAPESKTDVPKELKHEEKHSSNAQRHNKTGLPDHLKAGIEHLSGFALNDVKVHYNSSKPAQVQALAYTQGTNIHVAPGQEKHLPHEAWHVVQQKQGRVKPTLQMKEAAINDDGGLEREADAMGGAAVQQLRPRPEDELEGRATAASVIQRRTTLRLVGEDDVAPTDTIEEVDHTRAAVHATAARAAMHNSPWMTIPANAVCNHHVSYRSIQDRLLGHMEGETVMQSARRFSDLYGPNISLGDKDMGVAVINEIGSGRVVNRADVENAFNYYIYKICDFSENLFFWPNRTGGDPDYPKGRYASPGWAPASVSQAALNKTKGGLEAAAENIESVLG